MRFLRLSIVTVCVLLSTCFLTSAEDDSVAGTLSGSRYENRTYGFSVNIPEGWQPASESATAVVRKGTPDRVAIFLVLEPAEKENTTGTVIAIGAQKSQRTFGVSTEAGREYVEGAAHAPEMRVLTPPVQIWLGGIEFFRTDVKTSGKGQEHYFSFLAVGVKDRILAIQIHGFSQKALDDSVVMLVRAVRFVPSWSLPEGEMDKSNKYVRVSSGVSERLLQSRVAPRYPVEAIRNRIQGTVILNATISRAGKIQSLWLLDGDPILAAAAIEAVHQWQYRPYLLNGEPVMLDTKITVNFNLSR